MKQGRNDLCACGSGKKYKQCCERAKAKRARLHDSFGKGIFLLLGPIGVAFLIAASISALRDPAADGEVRRVWSAAHNHWHLVAPDGTETEARPGVVWSPEQGTFVNVQPISGAARKHVTDELAERIEVAEEAEVQEPQAQP